MTPRKGYHSTLRIIVLARYHNKTCLYTTRLFFVQAYF